MIANVHSLPAMRFAALCLAICLVTAVGRLHAQSDIVFMTADIDPGGQEKLVRFDSGSQSFTTDTGSNGAFLGVTVLNDEVLVADFGAEEIQRFEPDGSYIGPFATSILSTFLESDSNQNVYTTPSSLGPIFGVNYATRFNSAGAVTGTFSHPNFSHLEGIDADAAGNVYIVEGEVFPTPDRLYKFAPDGTFLNSIPLGFTSAADLAIDEVGNRLFVADQFGAGLGIKVFDISGAIPILTGSVVTPVSANIFGVDYAAESGNILATDFGAGSGDPRGLEISPLGVLLAEYRPTSVDSAWDITTFSTIPEPGSMVLMLLGVVGLVVKRSAQRR
jgi:hypothetical protein